MDESKNELFFNNSDKRSALERCIFKLTNLFISNALIIVIKLNQFQIHESFTLANPIIFGILQK